AVGRDLQVPEEKLNPRGGAVALGHPVGATGAILTVKALHELHRTNGQYALVTLCIGGGMGIAAIFERVSS
ncbi:MAG: acetyl-CoA C-acyltransferase, partial [Rubrobacter sp.]|nr:acetyl-CoA C-acyltransferase [Rubrobacter sp.]